MSLVRLDVTSERFVVLYVSAYLKTKRFTHQLIACARIDYDTCSRLSKIPNTFARSDPLSR